MNSKLVLLLVLVSLPPLTSSALRIPIIKASTIKKLWKGLKIANDFCSLLDNFGGGHYNCPNINTFTETDTEDTSPDISINKYITTYQIGTPQQNVSLIVDITLNLTFMLCQPCQNDCATESISNIYDRTLSSSFANYTSSGQQYTYTYTGDATSEGFLATDTFYFPDSSNSEQITFGCGIQNSGDYGSASGYLGLGNTGLSMVTQLGVQNFSYCLGADLDGAIFLGYDAITSSSVFSTPLLQNSLIPQLYYVNLTGIMVGNQDLVVPSVLPQTNGGGGMFISTTISITYLETSAYNATKEELINQMKLSQTDGSAYGLDLCFDISTVASPYESIPQLKLHLDGGVDLVPAVDNYFISDTNNTVLCFAVLPFDGVSLLGTWMQTNIMMFYDLNNSMLQLQSFNCSSFD